MRFGSYDITLSQIIYRCRQFVSVLRPQIDQTLVDEACHHLPKQWQPSFRQIPSSTMAHILRLYRAIRDDAALDESTRSELLILALTHDIGKSITRPTLFERVAKVLLPLPNKSHVIAGAMLMKKLGASRQLVRRIRTHHESVVDDRLLALFQTYDDRL
ncbi:MAG TPA: hypothetical protein PKO06_08185 [Candidatus Ozemobacteraceae bacterium]|nr:hypothetical protein [Candidatus Ozemobacteraceae bacterium]